MTDDLRARVLAAIDEQLKLCDAATPGPWVLGAYGSGVHVASGKGIYCHKSEYWQPLAEDERFIVASRLGWPAGLRFARGEVERHGIDTDYPDCYCCETRYPCPSILAAAKAFGVEL